MRRAAKTMAADGQKGKGDKGRMPATKGHRKGQRILAAALAVVMVVGIIIVDQTGLGRRRYGDSQAYAYLYESMECLSYGWPRWMMYLLGTQFTQADSADGAFRRACESVANEDFGQAAEWMRVCLEAPADRTAQDSATLYLQLACIQSLAGNAADAAASAQHAAQLDPERAQIQQLCYQFSLAAHDSLGAAVALASYAALMSDTSRYEEIADLYLQAGNYTESGRFYGLALETNGSDQRLFYLRGTCLMLQGRYREAIADFSNSEMSGSLYAKGICQMAINDLEGAAASLEASIERGEQAGEARLMLAACRLEEGDYEAVERVCDEYVQAGGAYAEVAYYQGTARMMLGDYPGALEAFDTAVASNHFAQESLFSAAQCRYLTGEYEAAAEQFERCVQAQFNTVQSQYYLGLCLAALGQNEQAEAALLQALGEEADG